MSKIMESSHFNLYLKKNTYTCIEFNRRGNKKSSYLNEILLSFNILCRKKCRYLLSKIISKIKLQNKIHTFS